MKYERIERATFLERPNRFIAYARIAGKQETIHVKNTGRCAELLVPEAEIFVQESDNPERKDKMGSDRGEKRKSSDQYGFPDSKQSRGRMAACRQFVS